MTLSRGFRSDAGYVRRTAVHVVAAALAGAAMSAAIWAGPAAAASGSRAQSRASASPSPARVKYYIVPRARTGVAPSLYAIAARALGDGNLFTEIFNLNKGRLQPDGGRLENPQEILAGWILELPADASGPGVHFGRLPGVPAPPAPSVSPRPSRPAAEAPAAHRSSVSWTDAGGGIVIVVVVAGLAVGLRRRRAAGAVRRRPTHARGSGPRPSAESGPVATAAPGIRAADSSWPGADYGLPAADHPSFPGADHPSFPGPDHPSFPGADHPSFPGANYPSFPAADHPSFPGADHPSFLGADHPSFPGAGQSWSAADYPGGPQAASLSAAPGARNLASAWRPPGAPPADAPGLPQRWSAPVATTAGTVARVQRDIALGDDRVRVLPTRVPAGSRGPATGPVARAEEILQLAGGQAARLADRVRREAGETRNADSVWLAGRILSDADAQAAAIRTAAEREAAEIRQQAAAIRAAAELEAAELRTAVMTMATDLGRVAGYVTENLAIPALPAVKPATAPDTKPAVKPATKPAARPAGKPAARPAARPSADRPAAKPGGPPRQFTAMRLTRAVTAALLLFALIAGTTEIGLHGYSFFVFRAAGTGSTPNSGVKEDQGPGQPDAPGAHQRPAGHKP